MTWDPSISWQASRSCTFALHCNMHNKISWQKFCFCKLHIILSQDLLFSQRFVHQQHPVPVGRKQQQLKGILWWQILWGTWKPPPFVRAFLCRASDINCKGFVSAACYFSVLSHSWDTWQYALLTKTTCHLSNRRFYCRNLTGTLPTGDTSLFSVITKLQELWVCHYSEQQNWNQNMSKHSYLNKLRQATLWSIDTYTHVQDSDWRRYLKHPQHCAARHILGYPHDSVSSSVTMGVK